MDMPACDGERLAQRLTAELGPATLLTGPETAAYAIDGRAPQVVVRPASVVEAGAALRIAAEARTAVAPWGGGTQMALGYSLARYDMALALDRMTALLDHDVANQSVTVQAGCTVSSLNAQIAALGQFAALDGPLATSATVGGRLATGSTGLRRGAFGTVRDQVLSLGVVGSDGRPLSTGVGGQRQVTGYDLNKLFVGSLGTLGLIVSATLRVQVLPEREGAVIVSVADAAELWPLFADLRADLQPQGMVVCGPGALGEGRGLAEASADLLRPASRTLLAVRLAGSHAQIQKKALIVRQVALKYGSPDRAMLMLWDDAMRQMWAALDNLPATRDLLPVEAVIKVAVLPSEVGQVIEMARGFSAEHSLRVGWIADATAGVAWLRLAGDAPENDQPPFGAALGALQATLARRWRNAIVLGCDPALKPGLPLWGADPQGLDLMRAIKSHFDAAGILNPGRFVGRI